MGFNVGDRVWLVDVYGELTDGEGIAIESDIITDIYVNETDPNDEPLYQTTTGTFFNSSLGYLVFKTSEEAEARKRELEDMEDNNGRN